MSSSRVNLENFFIPLEEINLATQNFDSENLIKTGESNEIYRGRLSETWKSKTVAIKRRDKYYYRPSYKFENELEIVSSLNHVNIIPFVGYYHKGEERIIVSEYAKNGSLDHYLHSTNSLGLSWVTRLKICIGAARGLEYLHSSLGDRKRVIHRDFKSANILLDDNMEARICDFDSSMVIDPTQPAVHVHATGTLSYLDPVYHEKGIVNTELDVYSFGVILFEMLNGMLAYNGKRIYEYSHPQTLISLVRNSYDDRLYNFIYPDEREKFDIRSFNVFKEIAYKCISLKLDDRPTMSEIIKRFEQALAIENHRAASTISTRSEQYLKLESFLIPVEDITLPIGYLSHRVRPRYDLGKLHVAHKGQLSERWQNRTVLFKGFDHDGEFRFLNEVDMFLRFNNENIIPFIGYYRNINDSILVLEYAINGSLYDHLYDPDKRRCLTWEKRLKICIGAARGLKYLHSGLGEHTRVIHANVKTAMILLDDKLEAKISGFHFSELVDDQTKVYGSDRRTNVYTDPLYTGIMKTESDVYSFGVVLCEVLSGMLAHEERSIGDASPQKLMHLVRRKNDGGLENIIDPYIKDEINIDSLQAFMKIAYRCISLNVKDRPTMNRIISRIEDALDIQNHRAASTITTGTEQLKRYLIPLEEIKLATKGFSPKTVRGVGGFGTVYIGQLSERRKNCTVAIKMLDQKGFQGKEEFDNELKLISSFRHKNIIPFVGYCDEGDQMILVTEYASNHSLDHHLQYEDKRRGLTWAQRLKICLGAAKGLNYLHSGLGKEEGVIHRDVKSANILLDINMEAKICDFGLSTQNHKNQQGTRIYTNAAGTNFYMDPIYQEGGILRKLSDVYSFGVVLFEILTGILAYTRKSLGHDKPQPLINLVRRYYDDGLKNLIDPLITEKIDDRCFHTYKEIAYKCISHTLAERPTMDTIIERIEDAMEFQGLKV